MNVDDVRPTHPMRETVNAVGQYAATATLASYPPSTVDNPPASPLPLADASHTVEVADDAQETSSLLQLPLPPPLPAVTGAANFKLVCLGSASASLSLLSSPITSLLQLLQLILPVPVHWPDYERLLGCSSKHGVFVIAQPRYDFNTHQYLPQQGPGYYHQPPAQPNGGGSTYEPWSPTALVKSQAGSGPSGLPHHATLHQQK